jgi:hypothetical protein
MVIQLAQNIYFEVLSGHKLGTFDVFSSWDTDWMFYFAAFQVSEETDLSCHSTATNILQVVTSEVSIVSRDGSQ